MNPDVEHLADLCVRFVGADGQCATFPCSAHVLHRDSALIRDMLSPELAATLERTPTGKIVVELRNEVIRVDHVHDALVAAHYPISTAAWPWDR